MVVVVGGGVEVTAAVVVEERDRERKFILAHAIFSSANEKKFKCE